VLKRQDLTGLLESDLRAETRDLRQLTQRGRPATCGPGSNAAPLFLAGGEVARLCKKSNLTTDEHDGTDLQT